MHFILFALGLLAVYLFYHLYWKRLAYPPGPMPVPIFGNAISLANVDRFEHKFNEWKKIYGPVYTYWLGHTPIVTVNDSALAVKTFVKEQADLFVNRGEHSDFHKYVRRGDEIGLIFTDGQLWENQRRFTLKFLRDFGLGKNQMQQRIMDEVQFVLDHTNKDIQAGVEEHDFYNKTDIAVGSIINSLLFGYRFTEKGNEAEFYRLKELSSRMLRGITTPLVLLSRFSNLVFHLSRRYCFSSYKPIDEIFTFIDEQINKRVKTEDIDENMEPRDLVDAFLIEKIKQKRLDSPSADLYTMDQLRGISFDVWFAGQETTASTINWTVAYLIQYPQVQKKLHEELDRVIGSDRLITVIDRQQLNYLNAVIMEVQRAANIVSQNLFRQASQDVVIDGHKIKKGTFCLTQISAIHYDETVFPEPNSFKPERFLDNNGQVLRCDDLMPFSLGKRICLGEGLARMELFLFISNLFNQYEFFAGKEPPVLKKYPSGGSTSLKMYTCKLRKRFQ